MGALGSIRKGILRAAIMLASSGGVAFAQDAPPPTCPKPANSMRPRKGLRAASVGPGQGQKQL